MNNSKAKGKFGRCARCPCIGPLGRVLIASVVPIVRNIVK